MFTKRNVVKFVKDQTILAAVTAATRTAIDTVVEEPTENQDLAIGLASATNGFLVMFAVQNKTDEWIDRFADWRTSRKAEKLVPAV